MADIHIISIETSTKVCSVALHTNGKLMAHRDHAVPNSHSELVNELVNEITTEAKLTLQDLSAIAISEGPGSYTGLRIGTSTAKGLCFALGIPLLSINTLLGMAFHLRAKQRIEEGAILCPMLDARRMEVYCMQVSCDGKVLKETEAKIIDENSFNETLKQNKMLFFGDGSEKCKEVISHENAVFMDDILPTSQDFGPYIYDKYMKEDFEDTAYFEPFYLKEFHTVPSKKNLLKV